MALKRVFAGFYTRYDGKPIFVVRVLKDICENYRMDLRRYKLIRERKQYIGISNRKAYQAMCEDLAFAQQSLKTVLNDYADLFRKRFSEGLSIRKAADAMQQNRGVIERRQAALYRAFAQLLQQRDEADGVCRLVQETEYDQRDIDKPQQATFACWGHSFLVQRHISINLRIFVIIHRFHSSRMLRREYWSFSFILHRFANDY